MTYKIEIAETAKQDLLDIFLYITNDLGSPQSAAGQLNRLEKAIASLDRMPERFRKYEKGIWQERNLRIMPADNYLVFYIPNHDKATVTVIRVMYGGRDIDRHLRELVQQKNNLKLIPPKFTLK